MRSSGIEQQHRSQNYAHFVVLDSTKAEFLTHQLCSNPIKTGSVEDYFTKDRIADPKSTSPSQKSQGYKCVLNSKASEDSQANLARWEPAHGRFGFRHPWSQYQKVGTAMRYCAYCIEALSGCINSEIQVTSFSVRSITFVP